VVLGHVWLYLWLAGDSRAVLSRGGRAIQVTDDHKPEREDEAVSRIYRAICMFWAAVGHCCRYWCTLASCLHVNEQYLGSGTVDLLHAANAGAC